MATRRAVLRGSAALAGVLPGCISIDGDDAGSHTGTLRMRRVSDRQLGRGVIDHFDVPTEVATAAVGADYAYVSDRAIVTEGSVAEGPEGSIYELTVEAASARWTEATIGFEPVEATAYDGEQQSETDDAATGETLEYDDLPPIDRAVVDDAFPASGDETSNRSDGATVAASATHQYDSAERSRSQLLGSRPERVRYEDAVYEVHVETSGVFPSDTAVSATEIAPDAATYGQAVREDRAVTLTDLSEAEQSAVEEAIDEEYRAEESDDAFESIVGKLSAQERLHESVDHWVVLYEGEQYVAMVRTHGPDLEGDA